MTLNEYQALAQRTANPALTRDDKLINGVLGLCGERGEVADLVKKWLYQGHELDREHLARELSDVMWYVAEIATAVGADMDSVECLSTCEAVYARFDNEKKRIVIVVLCLLNECSVAVRQVALHVCHDL